MDAPSLELLYGPIDTRQALFEFRHRGRIREAHIAVIAKRLPRYQGHSGYLEQVADHVRRGQQRLPFGPTAIQSRDVWEGVERAERQIARDAVDGVETGHDEVAALLERLRHGSHAVLRPGQRLDAGHLHKRRGVTGGLAL